MTWRPLTEGCEFGAQGWLLTASYSEEGRNGLGSSVLAGDGLEIQSKLTPCGVIVCFGGRSPMELEETPVKE